jgi:hypothetical protein
MNLNILMIWIHKKSPSPIFILNLPDGGEETAKKIIGP